MKTLKENLDGINALADADTVNAENFPAWTLSDRARLEQLALTGTMGNSFYANATAVLENAVALLRRAEPSDLAQAIIRGRNEGFIRTFPILGLVYLSLKDSALFQQVFPKIIHTGNDLGDFIDMTHKVRGFGRALKRAIADWLTHKTTEYYALKYRHSLADAIRLSRFQGDDPLYAYILAAYPGIHGNTLEKTETALARYPLLAARRDFVNALTNGDSIKALEIIRANALDVDSLAAVYNRFTPEIWQETARRTPTMRFLKYLCKFIREGVDLKTLLKHKLTVNKLREARVFPFRLFTAYLSLREPGLSMAQRQVADDCSLYLAELMDNYARQYDWDEFNRYSWVIAPDMSGSMSSPVGGSRMLTFGHISAMFTGFFVRGLEKVSILPWNTEVLKYPLSRDDKVMAHIPYVVDNISGGTKMEAAVEYMLEHGIKADYSVFITDTEEYGCGWLVYWRRYKKFCPWARAFLLRADSYQTAPISENDAADLGVYQIFGWNDTVLDFMRLTLERNR